MAKATYWHRGETLDYMNSTSAVIEANTIIVLSGRIGVAGTSINPGEKGDVHVTGIYKIAKTGKSAIEQGKSVYWDGEGITDASNDGASSSPTPYILAGYAAQAAEASDSTILVKLQG